MKVHRVPSRIPALTPEIPKEPPKPISTSAGPDAEYLETLRLRVAAKPGGGPIGATHTSGAEDARWQLILSPPTEAPIGLSMENLSLSNLPRVKVTTNASTVSAFTDWIYRIYGIPKNINNLSQGASGERKVAAERIPLLRNRRWELIHFGMQLPSWMSPPEGPNSPYNRDPYLISSLQIDGRPLRASPDLVFREVPPARTETDRRARIIIVEIKCTNAEVPPRLWPNVRAQLWAYSKIDEFSDASEIILVGEVWRIRPDLAMLDRTKVWKTPCADLDEEGNRLFHAYKAHLIP